MSQYSYVMINLILVISLIFVLVFFIKKFKLGRYTENKYIKIHNMVSVGPKEKIILIEINKTALLLGATPNHIEMLYAFDELNEHASENKKP